MDTPDDVMQIDEENMKELMKNVNLKELMQSMQQHMGDGEDVEQSEEEDEEDEIDLATVLSQFLLDSKKSRNLCDIMCEIKRQ